MPTSPAEVRRAMVSKEARMVRLELGESLARYASTGFSLRGGRPAVGTVGGASMAGAVGRPLPAEASGAGRASTVASCLGSANLRPGSYLGYEN